jgi:hypothetical protein
MKDEEFGDEVSRMLHRQAHRHPDHPDPVGMTKQHVGAARARRRKATFGAVAVTAAVAAVGAVWGAQAFAGNPGTGPAGVGAATTGHPTPVRPPSSAPSVTPASTASVATPSSGSSVALPNGPTSGPSTPPTGDDVLHGCDPSATPVMTAKNFDWPARGTLAADGALGESLLTRATSLTGGKNAKLAYAGENSGTRIAVVFVDPQNDGICGPGLRAVVFHGPKGTPADQLAAQIGQGRYGPQVGFQWSERAADGSLSLLLIEAPGIRTMRPEGILATKSAIGHPPLPSTDGTLLTSYAAGVAVPSSIDFTDPTTGVQGTEHVAPVVTAPTAEALATALATDPARLTRVDKSAHLGIAFTITGGPRFALVATDNVPGTEGVYWATFS